MRQLTINNSTSSITGLSVGEERELKKLLSYSIDAQSAYFSGSRHNRTRTLLTKRGEFPTGLLQVLRDWSGESLLDYEIKDLRRRPTPPTKRLFNLSLPCTPYPEQIESVNACAWTHRGTISACTGFGKSITMALLLDRLQVRTLIIVPNLSLKQQLTQSFKQYFGSLKNITIENIDSPKLLKETDYDCLIIDEAHHVAAKTYRKLNTKAWNNIYYRFFFTATPYRNKDEEQLLMESISGQVIYTVSYQEAVAKGYICPVEAYYIELPKVKTTAETWREVYSELVVGNKVRNDHISVLLSRLETAGASTLCLVKEIKHGEDLKKRTGIEFASGVADNTRILILEFALDERRCLIGTVGVLGEGVDTKPAEYVVIAGLGRSRPALLQQVGRGVRRYGDKTSCKVILFKDRSHKFTLRHFNEQVKVLRSEYGVEPVKLEII